MAAVAGFIAAHDGNIVESDQHSDVEHAEFFMRLEVDLSSFALRRDAFEVAWRPLAERFQFRWRVSWGDQLKRMAIFCSRQSHCLNDLLWRWKTGELPVELPLIISNHDELRIEAERFGVPFHVLPVTPASKATQERCACKLLSEARVDLIVLARYMQVLSPAFVARYRERLINIHHSFLPAFVGPRPYHQAFERGVKVIGATSHYVTDELDQGPIIAQSTLAVNHRDTVEDLIRKGRDMERVVLAAAVRQHVEDKILVSRNKTIVFE